MFRYLSADVICSEKRTVFRERSSRKTVSFEEQIMSKDKYLSIFLKANGGYCFYYPSNIFRKTQDLPVCHMSIMSKFFNWLPKFPRLSDFASVESICLRKKYIILKEKYNSVKDKSKIRVVDKVIGKLTTFREQDQSNIAFRKMYKPP